MGKLHQSSILGSLVHQGKLSMKDHVMNDELFLALLSLAFQKERVMMVARVIVVTVIVVPVIVAVAVIVVDVLVAVAALMTDFEAQNHLLLFHTVLRVVLNVFWLEHCIPCCD